MKYVIAPMIALFLAGCYASAQRYTDQPMKEFDKHTQYLIEDRQDGFTIIVYHERYQMFGNDERLAATGMDAAEAIALREANARGKQIAAIDPTTVTSNTGRDAWGTSSWSAKVPVNYKKG